MKSKELQKQDVIADLAKAMQDASKKDKDGEVKEEGVARFAGISTNLWGMAASKLIDYVTAIVREALAEWMAEQDKKNADKKVKVGLVPGDLTKGPLP